MTIFILFFPFLAFIIPFLANNYLGSKVYIFSYFYLFLTFIIVIFLYKDIIFNNSIIYLDLGNWLQIFDIKFIFKFDFISINMLFIILIISLIVHIYSFFYMEKDKQFGVFLSYLSLFTFFMILLVSANNSILLFFGWEGVGLVSYLLISFWSTRLLAFKAALQAYLYNRFGDVFMFLGLLWLIDYYKTSDIDIINMSIPSEKLPILLLFIGVVSKSSQFFLHSWLPIAMEGFWGEKSWKRVGSWMIGLLVLILCNPMNDTGFIFLLSPVFTVYQKEAITGLMLSDGYLKKPGNGNSRLEFTFKSGVLDFILWLKFIVLKSLCTDTSPTPYPKLNPTQYWFGSKSLLIFTELHSSWYKLNDEGKFIKIVPSLVSDHMTGVTLAFWIMGDGYWDTNKKTIVICTESFTESEIDYLILLLHDKLGLIAGKNKRGKGHRIRFSSVNTNIDKIIKLTLPHMHPQMKYKLGIINSST